MPKLQNKTVRLIGERRYLAETSQNNDRIGTLLSLLQCPVLCSMVLLLVQAAVIF